MNTVDYGDLRVGMTTTLDWVWDDKNTGANRDASIYNPRPEGDLLPIGSIGFNKRGSDNSGSWGVLLVGNVPGSKSPACRHPTDYNKTWNDGGGGGKWDLTMWRPVAPEGYVAMGEYCTGNYKKPLLEAVWCIRQDYVADASFPSSWWDDRGSGATDNASCWSPKPQSMSLHGDAYIPIRTDTFYAKGGTHTVPPPESLAKTLRLYVGSTSFREFAAPLPTFTTRTMPKAGDGMYGDVQGSVTLPYTAFFDPRDEASRNKIADPFVTISRSSCWYVAGVWKNDTADPFEMSQVVEYGITKEQSDPLRQSTGISVTSDGVVSAGLAAEKISMSLNRQLTGLTPPPLEEFYPRSVTEKVTVPAMTAVVLFTRRIYYRAARSDGSELAADLSFNASNEVHLARYRISIEFESSGRGLGLLQSQLEQNSRGQGPHSAISYVCLLNFGLHTVKVHRSPRLVE
ncbi:uncharacterized protein RHO25_005530 [Cercospora beticola]|uniref:DUF946 domain-containing protein n=1 Tax=Cercospora beticola TaxID=122368 RepID=A0ABZ0NMW0_CERBT|nr:hypothetical protein RHO25_005530 [Cercospora beticola]